MLDLNAGARALYWMLQETSEGLTRPISDAQLQGGLRLFNFGDITYPAFGRIVDTCALAHCYKVVVEKGQPALTAVHLSGTTHSAMGAKQLNTLQPGTGVWLLIHRRSYHAFIIGVEPPHMLSARRSLIDWISRCTRNRVDQADKQPLLMTDNGGATDWTAGRPFDTSMVGEAGWITETGLRIMIDPFMLQAAVDESCGLFAFYHDQLLRLAGLNLQMFTAGQEYEGLLDQAEYNEYRGVTPYPWEHIGLFSRGDPTVQKTPEQFQNDEPHYAAREPVSDKQQPWHRYQEFRGYLGQGARRMIVGPPPTQQPAQNEYEDDTRFTGLLEEQLTLSGQYLLRSAKGIFLRKSPRITVPKRLQRPEDPTGDTPENYRFAGVEGDGAEHQVTGNIEAPGDHPQLVRAAGVLDLAAYIFNWEGTHPFHYHEKDWDLPDEKDLGAPEQTPQFSELASAQFLQEPPPITRRIDDRYETVQYYPNDSYFGLLDDGGVVIGDGYGSEIRMTGGSVYITAPGDVFLKSGRNVVGWAGHDLNLRAKDSVDLCASTRDLRLKADNNMQLLAGNDADSSEGNGGILLESRATSPTFDFENKVGEDVKSAGIMLRSPHAPLVSWAKDVYLRTGGGEGEQAVDPGVIVLDADRGEQRIVTHSQALDSYVRSSVRHFFGQDGEVRKANEFSESLSTIGGGMCIGGTVIVANGGLTVEQNIAVASGHISTSQARAQNNDVGSLQDLGLQQAEQSIRDCETRIEQDLPQTGQSDFSSVLETRFYDDQKPGNDQVIESAGFSFRNQEQYKTEDWQLFEARWQQIARLSGANLPRWIEREVRAGSDETMPYPGKKKLDDEQAFQQLDLNGHDVEGGHAKPRDDDFYENPEFAEPQPKKLNDEYTVIVDG